jgi:hypothetical protein
MKFKQRKYFQAKKVNGSTDYVFLSMLFKKFGLYNHSLFVRWESELNSLQQAT